MHEFVYTDRILQSVLFEASRLKKKPVRVDVEVGEMLGLTEESMKMAYEVLSKGTIAERSRLRVRISAGSVVCASCGFSGRIPVNHQDHGVDPVFACPRCGASLRVTSGLGVELKEIRWEGHPNGPA